MNRTHRYTTLSVVLVLAATVAIITAGRADAHTPPAHACNQFAAGKPKPAAARVRCENWRLLHLLRHRCLLPTNSVRLAIRCAFGPYAQQALSVARCESGLRPWATNGQYLGLFQMGSGERARYGHGSDATTQARAAHRYFVASGRTWGPWSCKP